MKKIITICIATMMLIMCTSCEKTTAPELIDGYEHAEFNKYNSPAEENGLGDTPIYVEGTISETAKLGDTIYAIVKDEDKKEWLVGLGTEPPWNSNMYQLFLNKKMRVFGKYLGFSEAKKMPALFFDKMQDVETQSTYLLNDFLNSDWMINN